MKKENLPAFIIYAIGAGKYLFCFEADGKYICWQSDYMPAMDPRYPRPVVKVKDVAVGKPPGTQVADKGHYRFTAKDSRSTAEKRMKVASARSSFSFSLDGEALKGKFGIRKTPAGFILQKHKDKYAREEDVLSADLSRTVYSVMPGFDAKSFKLRTQSRPKKPDPVDEPEITGELKIGKATYRFVFYVSKDGSEVCVARTDRDVSVLELTDGRWHLLAGKRNAPRVQQAIIQHATALFRKEGAF